MEKQRLSNKEYGKLPKQPGVYKFLNIEGKIIYVGKAKNLVSRVSSYFTKTSDVNRKTKRLVAEIVEIEFTIVNSEFDALLLENNLIKENKPKYNILLKDDKSFPSICVTKERFPQIYSTRRIDRTKGDYFGPYSSVKAMNSVLELIRKLYKIRTCNFCLSSKNIENKKFKVCLEYHLGNCLGPCEGLQDEESYLIEINNAKQILSGQVSAVVTHTKALMKQAAESLNFEEAQKFKNNIELLDRFQNKSLIVNQKIEDLDVIGVISDSDHFYINYIRITNGAIRASETIDFKKIIDTPDEEILQSIIFTLRKKFNSSGNEIISNKVINEWGDVAVTIPQIGDKKKLIDLSIKNALYFKNDLNTRREEQKNKPSYIISQLQIDLSLKELPIHIECFDNSNIQGSNPVASMVCFRNAKPSKKDYRKYIIKTVKGPDDFLSMKEVVGRRYKRLNNEGEKLPNLIVIDGGKGQLHSACDALKEINLYGKIPIIGIAKKLEEIYFPEDSFPLHISKKSTSLKLIQQLRDEAHRFAITFHRQKRSKEFIKSELDEIKGIGPNTREKLMVKFKSIKKISLLNHDQLTRVIGHSKAKIVLSYFEQKKKG